MHRNKLIIIDGPAGVGKTTICQKLALDFLQLCWQNVDQLKEPYRLSPLGFNRRRDMPEIINQVKDLIAQNQHKVMMVDEAFGDLAYELQSFATESYNDILCIFLKADLKTVLLRNNIRDSVKNETKIIDTWYKSN